MIFSSELDTAYRILADHARMVTVCLADQLLPYAAPKMLQVLRRALRIQRDQFGIDDPTTNAEMTFVLAECVLDTLEYHYPLPDMKKELISSVLYFEVANMMEQDPLNNDAMNKIVKMVRILTNFFQTSKLESAILLPLELRGCLESHLKVPSKD